jgi:transposase
MRFVQARRMATLHSQARIEYVKTLLIAGRSRSEIGARLGLRRSVVSALVHRLKRDGVALPRSRPGPKPVIITPPKPVPEVCRSASPLDDIA